MKKILFTSFLCFYALFSLAQKKQVNNYQYIIVKDKLSFFKDKDKYRTSSLTKFLLKKNGFTVFLESDNLPKTLLEEPCNALLADVIKESSMFRTKVNIILTDCYNNRVFTSKFGESKEKMYSKSYQEAIRNAHNTMQELRYAGLDKTEQIPFNKEVINVAEVKRPLKKEQPIVAANSNTNKDAALLAKQTRLYAQPTENGFQLINDKPAIVFRLLETNTKDLYIIRGKNGILYKKGNIWVAEYYKNGELKTEQHKIKF
ncbi:hypothetical protein [uncultured Polaribacter sp.]|uniref:hypothetical protein n=1 Tax=uncultured Polaribacter sp. TaxID=174711 RepID=UPI00261CED77|nr:hypothetical protein [uncultured Polaribacter sp.]